MNWRTAGLAGWTVATFTLGVLLWVVVKPSSHEAYETRLESVAQELLKTAPNLESMAVGIMAFTNTQGAETETGRLIAEDFLVTLARQKSAPRLIERLNPSVAIGTPLIAMKNREMPYRKPFIGWNPDRTCGAVLRQGLGALSRAFSRRCVPSWPTDNATLG